MHGNGQVNCHRAYEIGSEHMGTISGLKFPEIKLKRSHNLPLRSIANKCAKIS